MDELTVEMARELLMDASGDASLDGSQAGAAGTDVESPDATTGGLDAVPSADASPADAVEPDAVMEARSYDESNVGLGVDIVEIARMQAILDRSSAFAKRVFSQAEQDYCNKKANAATHYALRFAAKEAVVKALGTGFANGVGVRDIEVERAASGKPSVRLTGRALEIAEEQGVRDLSISLSYTHTDAVACAMAITEAAARAVEKRKDPMEELARQFKETRSILDEL